MDAAELKDDDLHDKRMARLKREREKLERLTAFAVHMQGRFQTYRDHHGTTGTYPNPESVELLDAALKD